MLGDQKRARVARGLLEMRAARRAAFPAELFDEHAWDILLHLFSSMVDNQTITRSALIEKAGVSYGVGSRWLNHLVEIGQVQAAGSGDDEALTIDAVEGMRTFLDRVHGIDFG